jgi:DNA-binding IclR family transcriptional regulator
MESLVQEEDDDAISSYVGKDALELALAFLASLRLQSTDRRHLQHLEEEFGHTSSTTYERMRVFAQVVTSAAASNAGECFCRRGASVFQKNGSIRERLRRP